MKLPCTCGREVPPAVIAEGLRSGIHCKQDNVTHSSQAVASWNEAEGRAAKVEGMERAEAHADQAWLGEAEAAIHHLAKTQRSFTSDDVWRMLTTKTSENRALGPLFSRAAKTGWIKKGGFAPSTRPERHQAPVQVWESVVYGGGQ